MSTKHLVDSQLVAALELMPTFVFTEESLPLYHQGMQANVLARPLPEGDGVTRVEKMIPGAAGDPDVRILLFTPDGGAKVKPGLVQTHGGGYIMGSADMSDARCRDYAKELDCVVVSVDYRLAPAAVFPGPVEDCFAGLKWLVDNADILGVDRDRIAITGESAGGGLAAATVLLARERGIKLVYQALVYPMIDDRVGVTKDTNKWTGEFVWTREANKFAWNLYLSGKAGADDLPEHAAAMRAKDLAGLPAAYIGTGSLDLFLEEDVEYAMRLMDAGVPVDLYVYPGGFHGSDALPGTEFATSLRQGILQGLRRAFYPADRVPAAA